MKKVVVIILALALIVGVIISIFIFIKDQQIKASLENVQESSFFEGEAIENPNAIASEISAKKENGQWTVSETGEYTLDPSSLKFEFTGYKVGGEHTGTFNTMTADLALDALGQPVVLGIKLYPESVQTDSEGVDKHLQDTVFFNTAMYPEVQVVVKGIEKASTESAQAITDITIKDITKTVSVPVTISSVEGGVKFDVDTRIKISEWDIAFGPVQDEVRVMVSGVLQRK